MKHEQRRSLLAAIAIGAALVAPVAWADGVASPQEVRAIKTRLQKSPPTPADYAAKPYPGAALDADCSADASAPRQPAMMVYCYYTKDPMDKVRAFVKGEGKPRNGVSVTVEESEVAVDGRVTIRNVTRITYWVNAKAKAFHEGFPADPPPASELIAPLYPGATYDRECSAAKSLEARGGPKWRGAYCYVTSDPMPTVAKAFDSDFRYTSKRGVQVDVVEVSRQPPTTQIQYWLAAAGPQVNAAPPASESRPVTQPAAQPAEPQAASSPPAAATPKSQSADGAAQALDTVNKLRGLLGR